MDEASSPAARGSSSHGVVTPQPLPWHRCGAAHVIYWLARCLAATWRQSATMAPENIPGDGPVIFCVWHNRLALSMVAYFKHAQFIWRAPGLVAMISASRDGGLLAAVLEKFGVQPVRGSTSRRGRQALLESTTWLEKGYNVAITPDGPRGPRYRAQSGVVFLAQITGAKIVPVQVDVRGKIQLRSWDRFQVPLPFARCRIHFGTPMSIARDASEEERMKFRARLEAALQPDESIPDSGGN